MKNLFHIILLIIFCIGLSPVFADDEISNDDSVTDDSDKEVSLKIRKKDKKKKGERNVKIQPNKEDDENIILELDKN